MAWCTVPTFSGTSTSTNEYDLLSEAQQALWAAPYCQNYNLLGFRWCQTNSVPEGTYRLYGIAEGRYAYVGRRAFGSSYCPGG